MRAKYNTSVFLLAIILFANIIPVFSTTVSAEEEVFSTPTEENLSTETSPEQVSSPTSESLPSTSVTEQDSLPVEIQPVSEITATSSIPATTTLPVSEVEILTSTETSTTATSALPLVGFTTSSTETLATTTSFSNPTNIVEDATTTPFILSNVSDTGSEVTGQFNTDGTNSSSTATTSDDGDTLQAQVDDLVDLLSTSTLPQGTTTIDTGDAKATANILNLLNTNSINSTGTIQMANITDGYTGDLDFRPDGGTGGGGGTTCTLLSCNGVDSVTANISQDASIDNTLVLQAKTGDNLIDTAGQAIINTGTAFAGLNLVNVANVNFIDSNYFLLSLNSFKDINGDIVLPSLDKLWSIFTAGYQSDISSINTVSDATTNNNLDVNANTGQNFTDNTLSSVTNTGNANSATNIYNNVNTNLIGGKSVAILLRVTGQWLGKILGLPQDAELKKDGELYTLVFDEGGVHVSSGDLTTNIQSTSTAKINNDVILLADSGNNRVKDTLSSSVNTGDSAAFANVVNLANSNIIGRSWVLAVINIFGDFNGDIVFGRPDLVLSYTVEAPTQLSSGSTLLYKIKVRNTGDVKSSMARISSVMDKTHLDLLSADRAYSTNPNGDLIFELGDIAPNESKEITLNTQIKSASPGTVITNTSTVSQIEKDNNLMNNTDSVTVTTYSPTFGGGQYSYISTNTTNNNTDLNKTSPLAQVLLTSNNFTVTRTTVESNINDTSTTTHQRIVLKNLVPQDISSVVFYDIIYDANGLELQRETWDLGKVLANEEIELNYDISFGTNATNGVYNLSSQIDYAGNQKLLFANNGKIFLNRNPDIDNIKIETLLQNATQTLAYNSVSGEQNKNQDNYSTQNPVFGPDKPDLTTIGGDYVESQTASENKILIDPALYSYVIMLILSTLVSQLYLLRRRIFV